MSDHDSFVEPVSTPRALIARLTYAFVVGPLCILLMQMLSYIGVAWACGHATLSAVHVIPPAFVLLTLAGALFAYRDWSAAAEGGRRTRFLALSGMVLSGFSALVIAGMWSPLFVFSSCQR